MMWKEVPSGERRGEEEISSVDNGKRITINEVTQKK